MLANAKYLLSAWCLKISNTLYNLAWQGSGKQILIEFGWSNSHCNGSIFRMLRFNVVWHNVPFFFSKVLWWGDLLWLLDEVTSETEAGGIYGMIFWSKGLIFLFILSRFPCPLQGQCDFHSPDILKCCEMLMETIFTWVATTSGTRIHARHSHTGHTGILDICPCR